MTRTGIEVGKVMRRVIAAVPLVALLAACATPIPDSGQGVDSAAAQAQRDAALTGDEAIEAQAAADAAAANSGVAPLSADPSNPSPEVLSNPGISSEQDFETVSAKRSIETDAQRVAANRQQYVLIEPTDLPRRPGTNQPNIVAFALQTTHPLGTQLYPRSRLRSDRGHKAACGRYASADQAQIAFLSAGGPERDRRNLDPNGDGFACDWDPTPFRKARRSDGAATPATAAPASTVAATEVPAPAPAPEPVTATSPVVEPLVISSE